MMWWFSSIHSGIVVRGLRGWLELKTRLGVIRIIFRLRRGVGRSCVGSVDISWGGRRGCRSWGGTPIGGAISMWWGRVVGSGSVMVRVKLWGSLWGRGVRILGRRSWRSTPVVMNWRRL